VERPGGSDWLRHAPPLDPHTGTSFYFQALNRSKLSLMLDLKPEEGRAILLRLLRTADVLLETFRPGAIERLGLAYDTLADANPRLVYASLSGYGPRGPYRDRAGHDLNYGGAVGPAARDRTAGHAPARPGSARGRCGGRAVGRRGNPAGPDGAGTEPPRAAGGRIAPGRGALLPAAGGSPRPGW
jgi:alpha-methylacyl-CoA racemase